MHRQRIKITAPAGPLQVCYQFDNHPSALKNINPSIAGTQRGGSAEGVGLLVRLQRPPLHARRRVRAAQARPGLLLWDARQPRRPHHRCARPFRVACAQGEPFWAAGGTKCKESATRLLLLGGVSKAAHKLHEPAACACLHPPSQGCFTVPANVQDYRAKKRWSQARFIKCHEASMAGSG